MFTNNYLDLSNLVLEPQDDSMPSLSRCTYDGTPSSSSSSSSSVSSDSSSSSSELKTIKKKKKKGPSKAKTPLPLDFVPSDNTVLCGRSRECFESVGNRQFRVLCNLHLQDYLDAPGKLEKSRIVTKIMKTIRQACPVGAFVAYENGQWWEVSQRTAREKVGAFFRDSLPAAYRSSAKAKLARKRAEAVPLVSTPLNLPGPTSLMDAITTKHNNNNEEIDIIDSSLLECIAPVDDMQGEGLMEDNLFTSLFGAATFFDVECV